MPCSLTIFWILFSGFLTDQVVRKKVKGQSSSGLQDQLLCPTQYFVNLAVGFLRISGCEWQTRLLTLHLIEKHACFVSHALVSGGELCCAQCEPLPWRTDVIASHFPPPYLVFAFPLSDFICRWLETTFDASVSMLTSIRLFHCMTDSAWHGKWATWRNTSFNGNEI